VFRKDYLTGGSIDVTSEYLPTADISIRTGKTIKGNPQIMVFDNSKWRIVGPGTQEGNRIEFKDMGLRIVYLPVALADRRGKILSWPFVVESSGKLKVFRPRFWRHPVRLRAKYPDDESNTVFPGERYELMYWRGRWVSLGVKVTESKTLIYRHVPKGALLWLRNLDKGHQERIFSYEKGVQVWY